MIIKICVGSSCHLKGSYEIVELLTKAIRKHHLEDKISLEGSFCIGRCNRDGITVQIDDEIHVGITVGGFKEFFDKKVLSAIGNERE